MKWKSFLFCLSFLTTCVNANTLAPASGLATPSNVAKTAAIWKGGKWVTKGVINHVSHHKLGYAALAVVGGAFYFRKDIEDLVDQHMASDKWPSEKKSILVPKLSKKISTAKPQDKQAVISATQNALMYYVVMYNGESLGKTASDIADRLGIVDDHFLNQLNVSLTAKQTAVALINTTMTTTIEKIPKTNCLKGSYNRDYIKEKQNNSTNEIKLIQWDVASYEKQKKISENYNTYIKRNGGQRYDFHKDHIPSKKAIELFLKKRDNLIITKDIRNNIYNNATSVVLTDTIHRNGRTYGGKNKLLIAGDAKNLELAMNKDFITYYIMFSIMGQADPSFDIRFTKAYIETYVRNERLCLFRRR